MDEKMYETISQITADVLEINNLKCTGERYADTYAIHVLDIRLAMEAAYKAGQVQAIDARIAQVEAKIAALKAGE